MSVPDIESRTAIQNRVLQLMKQSETEQCKSSETAPAPMEAEEEAGEEKEGEEDDLLVGLEDEVAAAEAENLEASGLDSVDNVCADEMKHCLAAHSLKLFSKNN